ncbi:hypothetical protein FACHB389_25775 [Nostoc calcicola FACHB-389]|nr:antibiotic biosynthesis monooxygenase [Nostoc calcicola FACHB-3891]OKH29763.1 hypothetical protein FACHB389_25775 [Nostoc calcicola FACHB-389]
MFVVIFEVKPKTEQWEEYLSLAKLLRPELEKIDGFIDNERFSSTKHRGKILSLSTWRDEKSLIRWRTHTLHHNVQDKARSTILVNYHLRVGEVFSDTQPPLGHKVQEQRFDETETGEAKTVVIAEAWQEESTLHSSEKIRESTGFVSEEIFESIYQPGKFLQMTGWTDIDAASVAKDQLLVSGNRSRYREVRVIRDYGMSDRVEAPQYHPEVELTQEALIW